jgi:ribosomal-protein-alanine N-acetyltransferase
MGICDVVEVAAMEKAVFSDPWSADSFLAEVERNRDVGYPMVIRSEGELIAYAVVWFIVDEIHIGNIAVRPDRHRQGLGALLMNHILDEGRRRSMAFATLEVRPSNAQALALYRRFGFREVAIRKNYYHDDSEDALVLSYALDPSAKSRFG